MPERYARLAVAAFAFLATQPLIVLFGVIGLGMALGRLTVARVSLGSSAVLFVGLVAGHFALQVPAKVGSLGLVLFVYCVGIGAGSTLMSVLARDGTKLARLAALIVSSGALLTWALSALLKLPGPLAGGLFAGALTSTPALAAAREAAGVAAAQAAVGYGIAYPFGVITVVVFVQLLPRLTGRDTESLLDAESDTESQNAVETVLVEVTNANLFGKRIADSGISRFNACLVSRVLKNDRLIPLHYEDQFQSGQHLLVVGRPREIAIAVDYLGRRSERPYVKDVENERRRLVVTDRAIMGKTLRDIAPLKNFGVIVTRVTRHDITFVANAETKLANHDLLLTVGEPRDLTRFAEFVGHRTQAFDETDLMSLSLGLTLGIVMGLAPFGLPGGGLMTLGLAGGPLVVGLALGHFGKVGSLVGYIPRGTRLALQELGLVLFLAEAGIVGGRDLVETVSSFGASLLIVAALVALLPMALAYFVARKILGLDLLQTLGGICGGMTSTPALGSITARVESSVPVASYAAAYPVALVFMTVLARWVVESLI